MHPLIKPRVLVLADVPGWAWGRKARAYQQHLADRFAITVAYHAQVPPLTDFDLIHLFEVSQVGVLTPFPRAHRPFKALAGLTAHVWRTWGHHRMDAWAAQVDALHGNSQLLVKDLNRFHERVYYTPNGVDPERYRRLTERPPIERGRPLPVFGHVGKPNPRKGGDLIIHAARAAKVELRLIQRTSKLALTEAQMLDWYQGIDVMVTASNMDGTPNPMLEGAACECALLSTPIGNMPEFIAGGWNGRLLPELAHRWPNSLLGPTEQDLADNRAHLQHALTAFMSEFADDPENTRRMGLNARQTVLEGWTWAQQVQHVATMWTEVLG